MRAYRTVISSPENLISSASRAPSRVYRPISSSSESSPDTEKLLSSPVHVPLPNWSPGFHEDLNNLFRRRPDDLLTVEDDSPERLSGSTAQDLLNFPEIDEVTAEDLKNLYDDDPQTLQPSGSTALQPYEGNKDASHLTGVSCFSSPCPPENSLCLLSSHNVASTAKPCRPQTQVSTSELHENVKKLPVEEGKSIERGDASTNPTGFGDHLDDDDDYLDDDYLDDDYLDDDYLDDDPPRTEIPKSEHIFQDLPNKDSAVQDLEHEHGSGKITEVYLALKDVKKRAKEAHALLSELRVNPRRLFDIASAKAEVNEAVTSLGTALNFLLNISDKHPSKKSLNYRDIIPSFGSVKKRSRDTKRKNRFSQK